MENQALKSLNIINNALSRAMVGGVPSQQVSEGYDASAEIFAIDLKLERRHNLLKAAGAVLTDMSVAQMAVDEFTVEYPEQDAFLTSTDKQERREV